MNRKTRILFLTAVFVTLGSAVIAEARLRGAFRPSHIHGHNRHIGIGHGIRSRLYARTQRNKNTGDHINEGRRLRRQSGEYTYDTNPYDHERHHGREGRYLY